jgi:TPR repeat protein
MKSVSKRFLPALLMIFLAGMCQGQSGYQKTPLEALKNWAVNGDAEAQCELAYRYEEGSGGAAKDHNLAVKWMNRAADNGNPEALQWRSKTTKPAPPLPAGFTLDDKSDTANSKYPGTVLPTGLSDTAIQQWILAEQGDADAQVAVAIMYFSGVGVEQNYSKAAKWFLKAAEQGNVNAQFNLNIMYHNGLGVPKDEVEAEKWRQKATRSAAKSTGLVDPFANNDSFAPETPAAKPTQTLDAFGLPRDANSFVPDAPGTKPTQMPAGLTPLNETPSAIATGGHSRQDPSWSDIATVFAMWLVEMSVVSCVIYAICWLFIRKYGGTAISLPASWHAIGIAFVVVTVPAIRMAAVFLFGQDAGVDPKGQFPLFYFTVVPIISTLLAVVFLRGKRMQSVRKASSAVHSPPLPQTVTIASRNESSPPSPPPITTTITDKKETDKMNAVKKGVLAGAIVFVIMLAAFWPTLDTVRKGYGKDRYTVQCVNIRGEGPLCISYVFGYALASGVVGLVVWAWAGRKRT